MNYIFLGVILVLVPILFFALKKFIDKKINLTLKIFSIFLAICFFIRNFASDYNILENVVSVSYQNPYATNFECVMVAILNWLTVASTVILIMLPFFKYRILKNYAKTLSLVVSMLNIVFLGQIIYSYTLSYDISLLGVFFAFEVATSFLYSLYIFLTDRYFKIEKKELIEMLIALPIILILSVPPYLPKALFGNFGSMGMKDLSFYHRIYLYLTFIFLIGMYFLLKKKMKDKEYIRMVLLHISLVALVSYCFDYDFERFLEPTRWPLHLCNTAMFIIPICLMFRL